MAGFSDRGSTPLASTIQFHAYGRCHERDFFVINNKFVRICALYDLYQLRGGFSVFTMYHECAREVTLSLNFIL